MASVRGVALPDGYTGSSFLHRVLTRARDNYGDALGGVSIPDDPKHFKKCFGDVVVKFEAARAASGDRAEIARAVRRHVAKGVRFVDGKGSRLLSEVMGESAEPLSWERIETKGPGTLLPSVEARGTRYDGADEVRRWLSHALDERILCEEVHAAMERLLARGERLSLAGERFVLLGGAAELSPAPLLLAAGAEVLWFDLRGPDALRGRTDLGGTLYVPGPANILESPGAIAATIRAFAAEGPVHIGMYAYAGGESQEWRLTAAMNGIVSSLPAEIIKSVAMLISPTTAMVTGEADLAVARRRRADAQIWKRVLGRAGVLRHSHVGTDAAHVACSIVPLQGASYQAAQYVGKTLAAEALACWGPSLEGDPITVSANIAPITATRSLSHPVFEAGFIGAPMWGIYISEPPTTRELQALVMMHDVTDPEAPGCGAKEYASDAARARALFSQQTHGGVFAQPFALMGGIQVAAVGGFTKKPRLLAKMLRG